MPLNHTDTELQSLKINSFETLADYQAAYAQGLIDANELSFIDENIQPDWNQTISTASDYIKNKPTLSTVATSGSYNDLDDKPTLSTVATSGDYGDLANAPTLATVATSGSYNDLDDKPTIPTVNDAVLTIQKNGSTIGTFSANSSTAKTVNITVATTTSGLTNDSGFITNAVNDLANYYKKTDTYTQTEVNNLVGAIDQFKYEIYASTSVVSDPQGNVLYLIGPTGSGSDKYEEYVYANNTWTKIGDTSIDLSGYATTASLSTVATSGSYKDLTGKPTLATVATSGSYNDLTDKPTLATVATSGSYNDLDDKPTIPTVNDATLTITRNSVTVGTFSANEASNKKVDIEVPDAANTGILTITRNSVTVGTFSANEASNKTVDITVPTVGTLNTSSSTTQPTNSAESLGGTVNLHKVSKTGKYTDLLGAPTVGSGILSVNIGTYTIGTFGANDGSDKTITLPTATDEDIDVLFSGFTVNVTVGTGGGGTVSASSSEVDYGGSVTLTATANTNWAFLKWSDNNTSNPRTISNVTENISLSAIFEQTAFTVRALETRILEPGDISNPQFLGTAVLSLSTSQSFPVGTVTEITVQKNGTVYLENKTNTDSFNDVFGGLTWDSVDSQNDPPTTQCGLLLAYEYSVDNGATWIPMVYETSGSFYDIFVNSDMLVRFVQTGTVYRMGANLSVSGDSDWFGSWQFSGFIGTNPDNYPYGISKTFASISFDNYPNYNIPYYGDLAVFNGMRLYIESYFNVSAMGISSGDNTCRLNSYNSSYDYDLYNTTLDGNGVSASDSAVVVFGTGYFPELGQYVYNVTVAEKPSAAEEYYLDSYFNFSSMNEPIDPENPDEPAW